MNNMRLETAAALEQSKAQSGQFKVFVGLDGFVDEIFHVVDKRESATVYTRLPTIAKFAERMAQAAGKSTNIELASQMVKLGGNGPIMANALASFDFKVTYLGNLGYPNLHPIFSDFAKCAQVHTIAEPGYTDALEFKDGKVMVGKHQSLKDVNWENIEARFGVAKLEEQLAASRLICFVNWTMLTAMTDIWKAIQSDIAPKLKGERRLLFIDLADPEKRTAGDIQQALDLIGKFNQYFDVILGLNEKESVEIGQILNLDCSDNSGDSLMLRATQIRERIQTNTVVIHPVHCAVAASESGSCIEEGPFTAKPLITTGAGDHFNAGFCLGRLLGLTNQQSLCAGVATSGHYVRHAQSPSISDLVNLLRNWPERELNPEH